MRRRSQLDVAHLSDSAFGSSAPIWWGNLLMMVIEGSAFALVLASYFYLRRNFDTWPPPRTFYPDAAPFIANLIVLIVVIAPMAYVAKLAKAHASPAKIGTWLMVAVVLGALSFVIRIFEFKGLHTRWDSNAYGSVVWALLGMHVAHILAGTLENLVLGLKLFVGPVQEEHYVDCTLNAVYWYFIIGSWLVIFAVVFVAVRFI